MYTYLYTHRNSNGRGIYNIIHLKTIKFLIIKSLGKLQYIVKWDIMQVHSVNMRHLNNSYDMKIVQVKLSVIYCQYM